VERIALSNDEESLRVLMLGLEQKSADLRHKAEWLLLDLQARSIDSETAISRMMAIIREIKNIRAKMDKIREQMEGKDHSHDKASNRYR